MTNEQCSVPTKLYLVLKQLYEMIDSPSNPQLSIDDYILHEIKYSGQLQQDVRNALKSYEDSLHSYGK